MKVKILKLLQELINIILICLVVGLSVSLVFEFADLKTRQDKRDLQLSIELKELQIQKLHCELKTGRCPNG